MAVPADWWVINVSFGLMQLAGLFFIWIIFDKVQSVAGWSLNEMVFLYGLQLLSTCIYRGIFQSVDDTPHLILRGLFDNILIMPRNILFMLSVRRSNRTGYVDLLMGLTLIIAASIKMAYQWDALKILQLVVFILSANLIMTAVLMAQGALAFWITNFDAFHEVVMAVREYTRYPVKIFGIGIRIILYTVIPLAFASYIPASVLLAKEGFSIVYTIAPVLVGIIAYLLSVFIVKQGLKNYTSSN
jgi:ABC-2 type transport system permease protein